VTTDFDVLEDMLVKDWDVAYSFSIRYKHLLVKGQGQQETDRDIDHILGVVSGEDEAEDHDEDSKSDDDDKQNCGDVEEEDESDDEVHHGAPTGRYLPPGGNANMSRYPYPHFMSAPFPGQHSGRSSNSTMRSSEGSQKTPRPITADKQHEMQAYSQIYPYGPPLGPWGQPLPYTSFGGYGGYGMHGGYGAHGSLPNNSMDNHLPYGYTDRKKVCDAVEQVAIHAINLG
jgi:hypothetical protein